MDGRFKVERLLGVGGMGCVFEALQVHLNQRVALKFLLPEFAFDPGVITRFTREARAAVRLTTEHVGRVLDFGTLPSGSPFLVMEYLEGENLERRLEREGPFPWPLAARLIADAALALEEAHALGVIHRDLKPANLFLARRSNGTEVLKVLDFGIARSVHPEIERGLGTTSGKMLLGTPLYMAPEQLTPGAPLDARTDVWALGCVLVQLITGAPPFPHTDLVELMYAVARQPHRRVHGPVAPIVDRCLSKDPSARFSTAAELRHALEALEEPEEPLPNLKSPTRWWVLGAVGLALLGGAVGLALSGPDRVESTMLDAGVAVIAVEPVAPPDAGPDDAGLPAAPPPPANPVRVPRPTPTVRSKPQVPLNTEDLLEERR